MTTVATDGVSMAGDGMACTEQFITTFDRRKVHRMGDGSILGCAGNSSQIREFLKWKREGGKHPRLKDFAALHLLTDGTLDYYGDDPEPTKMNLPAAIGSGAAIAIGALEAGADATTAVEIASKRDPHTGGTVTSLWMGEADG